MALEVKSKNWGKKNCIDYTVRMPQNARWRGVFDSCEPSRCKFRVSATLGQRVMQRGNFYLNILINLCVELVYILYKIAKGNISWKLKQFFISFLLEYK